MYKYRQVNVPLMAMCIYSIIIQSINIIMYVLSLNRLKSQDPNFKECAKL